MNALVPAKGAYEIRVGGPMVTPGYFGRPEVLKNRSALIELLYRQPPPDGVVVAGSAAPC